MRTDQSERLDQLQADYAAGNMTPERFQAESFAILTEDEEPAEQTTIEPPVGDNPPPSPIHVWNGDAWVLPAAHEITMLVEMDQEDEVDVEEDLESAQQRLTEQTEMAGETS